MARESYVLNGILLACAEAHSCPTSSNGPDDTNSRFTLSRKTTGTAGCCNTDRTERNPNRLKDYVEHFSYSEREERVNPASTLVDKLSISEFGKSREWTLFAYIAGSGWSAVTSPKPTHNPWTSTTS